MARIVIIQHETEPQTCQGFALQLLINEWHGLGHEVLIAAGTKNLPDGDLAFLHVNLSLVPQAYADAARQYPRTINAGALDIRKRTVSRNIIDASDEWEGPVILKTDLNCLGIPEYVVRNRKLDEPVEPDKTTTKSPRPILYQIFGHSSAVPNRAWSDSNVVVERFLPEQDQDGYYLRTWIFLGDRERCRRFRAQKPLIKGSDYLAFSPCEVPEFLRSERERLGFDYGKFDFVIHKGEPILLDANKTMGIPPATKPALRSAYSKLAGGLDAFLAPPIAA